MLAYTRLCTLASAVEHITLQSIVYTTDDITDMIPDRLYFCKISLRREEQLNWHGETF